MSLERILALINKYTDIPIDTMVRTVAQDILNDMNHVDRSKNSSCDLANSTLENIQILDSLLIQSAKKSVDLLHQGKDSIIADKELKVFCVWEALIKSFIVHPCMANPQQLVFEFLTTCLALCPKEMTNNYETLLHDVVFTLSSSEEENQSDKFKNAFNFIETVLHSKIHGLEHFHDKLVRFLKEIVLSAKVKMLESSLIMRITGIITSGLRNLKKTSLCIEVCQDIHHALDEWGQSFAQSYSTFSWNIAFEESSLLLQTCLLLIDFLLEDFFNHDELHKKSNHLGNEQSHHVSEILNNPLMWIIIQNGLSSKHSYTRKQALYNLKKAIAVIERSKLEIQVKFPIPHLKSSGDFENELNEIPIFLWNQKDNKMLWSDFLLVAETLEENQLHVITPLLTRLDGLVEACKKSKPENSRLHTSWVCVLLLRMLKHESKAVIQEGITKSLSLDASMFPFLEQETCYHLLCSRAEGLIPALQDANLYLDFRHGSPVQDKSVPSLAKLIQGFVEKCMSVHSHKARFLTFLLKSLSGVNWSSVPLYYVCSSIAILEASFIWNSEDLHVLGSILAHGLRTHNETMRNGIQKLLLKSMILFCDCSKVTCDDVIRILLLCNVESLIQNSKLFFEKISTWFVENLDKFIDVASSMQQADPEVYLLHKVEKYLKSSQSNDNQHQDYMKVSQPCALLMILFSTYLTGEKKIQLWTKCLQHLIMITDKASTHLYMPTDKVFKVIALLKHLTSWNYFQLNDDSTLWQHLYKVIRGLTLFVAGRFPVHCADVTIVELCLDVVMVLIKTLEKIKPDPNCSRELASNLMPMIVSSNSILGQNSITMDESKRLVLNVVSVKCMVWSCKLQKETTVKFNSEINGVICSFLSSMDLQADKAPKSSRSEDTWGKMIEKYLTLQWAAIPYAVDLLRKSSSNILEPISVMKSLLLVLDLVTEDNIPVFFQAMQHLIPEVLKADHKEAESIVHQVLDDSWKIIGTVTHSPAFWPVYDSFVKAAYQSATLSLPAASVIHEQLASIMSEICILSVDKPGLLQRVSDACIACWMVPVSGRTCEPEENKVLHNKVKTDMLKNHIDFVVQCLTFSHAYKKEDLALRIAISFVEEDNNATALPSCDINVSTVTMLLQLDCGATEDVEFVCSIVQQLLQLDERISQQKARYHSNSVQHHIKNKIYQAVILLLKFIPEKESEKTIEFLINHLKNDAQPSVSYLMEWSLALLLCKHPTNDHMLFAQLTGSNSGDGLPETPAGSAKFSAICSYLTVALFLGLCRSHQSMQDNYFLQLVDICIPWCMCQHFSIRLYSHAVVLKVKLLFEEKGCIQTLLEKYPFLPSCLSFADESSGNVGKNWQKMKDNFFIFDLDPIKDLSLETVYSCLPRLCCLPNYVSLPKLLTLFPGCNPDQNYVFKASVSLFNRRSNLRLRKSTDWIPQESKHVETVPSAEDRYRKNYGLEISENVQKKIMPWFEQLQEAAEERDRTSRREGLVLVASLIDKPSNLGGLTRTCEIFGAEALVVQSLSCTSNKLYQSLSVTAHKWLPMKEVKPWQLENYLIEMRKRGYTLIGTEQTAQSVCLSKYNFPKKCVVVLGNEKEGIPIPILKVLDVCVQIPQKGIVRSLNVHVSGAITVWEHARQTIQRS